jgi:hypothetical protein
LEATNNTNLHPSEILEDVTSEFVQWLHNKRTKSGEPLHPNTIRKTLGAVGSTLQFTQFGKSIADRMPKPPKGAALKAKPTQEIPWSQLMQIWAAAEKEVLDFKIRWEKGRKLITLGKKLMQEGRVLGPITYGAKHCANEENIAICLAMVSEMYPVTLPSLKKISKENDHLRKTLQFSLSHREIIGYLYPSSRDLIPFVLLIGIATVFNPDVLLSLNWENINRKVDRLGVNSIEFKIHDNDETEADSDENTEDENLLLIEAYKPRSNKVIRRLLDPSPVSGSEVNLNLLLDILETSSVNIRPFLPPEYKDRIFVFVPTPSRHGVRGFGTHRDSPSGDNSWWAYLAKFCDDHKIPRIQLKQIRLTLIDYVQLINRGDLDAARKVGNHTSRITTWTHYTSSTVRKLLQESAGELMIMRDRWFDTSGKIDPRITPISFDKSCSTPGFQCLDAFDSPMPNQKKGSLCRAYGMCPSCPMAIAQPSNQTSVTYWEALQRAIYRSVTSMGAEAWIERWSSIASDLKDLLELVPLEVLTNSRRIKVELPNVG